MKTKQNKIKVVISARAYERHGNRYEAFNELRDFILSVPSDTYWNHTDIIMDAFDRRYGKAGKRIKYQAVLIKEYLQANN